MEFDRKGYITHLHKEGWLKIDSASPMVCCAQRVFEFREAAGCGTWAEAARGYFEKTGRYKGFMPRTIVQLNKFIPLPAPAVAGVASSIKSNGADEGNLPQSVSKEDLTQALIELLSSPEKLTKELLEETNRRQGLEVALQESLNTNKAMIDRVANLDKLSAFVTDLAAALEVEQDENVLDSIKAEVEELRQMEQPVNDLVSHWRDAAKKAQSDFERINKCHLDLMDEVRKLKESIAFHDMLVSECKNLHEAGKEVRSVQFIKERERVTRVLQMMRVVA